MCLDYVCEMRTRIWTTAMDILALLSVSPPLRCVSLARVARERRGCREMSWGVTIFTTVCRWKYGVSRCHCCLDGKEERGEEGMRERRLRQVKGSLYRLVISCRPA